MYKLRIKRWHSNSVAFKVSLKGRQFIRFSLSHHFQKHSFFTLVLILFFNYFKSVENHLKHYLIKSICFLIGFKFENNLF